MRDHKSAARTGALIVFVIIEELHFPSVEPGGQLHKLAEC